MIEANPVSELEFPGTYTVLVSELDFIASDDRLILEEDPDSGKLLGRVEKAGGDLSIPPLVLEKLHHDAKDVAPFTCAILGRNFEVSLRVDALNKRRFVLGQTIDWPSRATEIWVAEEEGGPNGLRAAAEG